MRSLIEKIFKRQQPAINYVIGEYKPSRASAKSKPARTSEYEVESPYDKDEMEIDNIYRDN